jgi:cholesterol transport system auxiliary component
VRPLRLSRTLAALLAVPLAACSGFLHSTAQPEQAYFLRAPLGGAAAAAGSATSSAPGTPVSLRVGHPLADPGLDSAHIMLVRADHRMDFYSGSRWPAPVPDVVESLAVQTLRASAQWASVEDSRSPFPSSYLLQVTVRRFDADYTGGGAAPEVQVVLDCILGRREGRDVVATFIAAGTASASANRLAEVVAAFEQATGTALTALAQQSLAAVRADQARAAQNAAAPRPSSSLQSQ